jgi:hypothetical protein
MHNVSYWQRVKQKRIWLLFFVLLLEILAEGASVAFGDRLVLQCGFPSQPPFLVLLS